MPLRQDPRTRTRDTGLPGEGTHARRRLLGAGQQLRGSFAIWGDPAADDVNVRWLRDAMHAVEPLGTGHYVAEADLTADVSRARLSFAPADWERLRALKARYDPENVFHSYLQPA